MGIKAAIAYVDGYSLYHGIIDKRNIPPKDYPIFCEERPWGNLLWLDIESLLISYNLPGIQITKIKHFEARTHKPDSIKRQNSYKKALLSSKTINKDCIFRSRFNKRNITCPKCNKAIKLHQEKKTDVQIATEMLSDFYQSNCEAIIFVGGDSDFVPIFSKILSVNSSFELFLITPPLRESKELSNLIKEERCRNIEFSSLVKNQFPNPVIHNGSLIYKPPEYDDPLFWKKDPS